MKRIVLTALATGLLATALPAQTTLQFSTARRGPVIGDRHYGIFYEEINHAGDGGIYAELVRNGSMEENSSNPDYWWTVGTASMAIASDKLLNGTQKRAMQLTLKKACDGVRNIGYWGINVVEGERYRASLWVRTALATWTGDLTLTLENYEGKDLGHAVVRVENAGTWLKLTADITATGSSQSGWLAIRGSRSGTLYLDCVSLFPPTFKDRPNGMRRDLAQKLADLRPRFMRFPGGCYIEGGNRFQWKHTIGPVEERLGLYNSHWGYPVSNGMGFHEFLQLAEDLGAEPLFVVNVGIGHGWFEDYQHIEGYIEEALDAIEYCNGDTTTTWGRQRARNGHPEPFGLQLLEIGNENYNFTATDNSDQSDHYAERYKQFRDAIKARFPEVECIGNVESWGTDNPTWRNQYAVGLVDEHYYRSPDWFAANYRKYDNASRTSHKIYNGEYAVTSDFGTNGSLKAALGEAIYMAGMERNSDVCVMASYAPIFMNENEAQWRPDMLHYNAHSCFGTPSYWTQQMMASTVGHQNITWTETDNSVNLSEGARLALGSWGTSVTYNNIKVTNREGEVVFESDEAITTPESVYGNYRTLDVVTDDCTIELDATKVSGNEGFLLTFAYGDSGNYAWWNLGGWGNGQHGVEQAVGGQKRTLATTSGSITTGQTYRLKVVRSGLLTRLYLDDKLVQSATLSGDSGQRLYLCASLNEAEDTAIVKLINYSGDEVATRLAFADATIGGEAGVRVMSNPDNAAENSMADPLHVSPVERTLPYSGTDALDYTVPPYSLSVVTIPLSSVSQETTPKPADKLPTPAIAYDFEGSETSGLQGGAAVMELSDGNHALYTGENARNGYLDLGNSVAKAIAGLANGEAYSISTDIMLQEGGNLNAFCWAWAVCNGTSSYIGMVNTPNNLNWYFEKVRSGTTTVRSQSGLSQREWHNITVTADASLVSLYVDGELRATGKPNTTALPQTAATNAWIGRSPFAADKRMTETWFDDFQVYDSALTPEQVLALYMKAREKSTSCEALLPIPDTTDNAEALTLIGDGTEVDITSLLVNPDFAQGTEGWEGTLLSAAPGTVAEQFYKLFDTYQVLHNMPAGTYRLEWQGFYRNGNIANAYQRHTTGTEVLATEVYAAADADHDGDRHDYADLATTPLGSLYDASGAYTYSPYTYPDNVGEANTAFAAGRYRQSMLFCLTETADLRLGLRKMTPCVYDWACFDNFRLTYVNGHTSLTAVTPLRASLGADGPIYDLAGRRILSSPLPSTLSPLPSHLKKGLYIRKGKKIVVR
ncbi:MAG: hypothetical protein IJ197_08270 [Bacteroidaceae bacterium]|nr:hypothetical protein [Bacteroidaceae bacterium]